MCCADRAKTRIRPDLTRNNARAVISSGTRVAVQCPATAGSHEEQRALGVTTVAVQGSQIGRAQHRKYSTVGVGRAGMDTPGSCWVGLGPCSTAALVTVVRFFPVPEF